MSANTCPTLLPRELVNDPGRRTIQVWRNETPLGIIKIFREEEMKRKKMSYALVAFILFFAGHSISCAVSGVADHPATASNVVVAGLTTVRDDTPFTPKSRSSLKCGDDTKEVFNRCGIEVLPFVRTAFFDIDGDGRQELIAGSKDGTLRLYRNSGTAVNPAWAIVERYFEGISTGAFSSPAVGDIDEDGRPELILGTGGFSSDSGRVLFFKNSGKADRPLWIKMDIPAISVGNDATPALLDIDRDGRPDLVVGNSTGNLFLFRNHKKAGRIVFEKDADYFRGMNFGMYVVPAAAVSSSGTGVIIAGNSMGKVYILEKAGDRKSFSRKASLSVSMSSFAAPAFVKTGQGEDDLVISDGSGQLVLFKNTRGSYREWERVPDFFDGRTLAGAVCAPGRSDIRGRSFMVVGNINGEIKLFEYLPSSNRLPWVERAGFFKGIKLPGFSRGILADWHGKELLITGQQDGVVKAFMNSGSLDRPQWAEQKAFFRSIPKMLHAAPSVFDLDGDGRWELIVGDADGYVHGFRYQTESRGMPVWESAGDCFKAVKVGRFAAPAVIREAGVLYLFVGEQDGRIKVFTTDADSTRPAVFHNDDFLDNIKVNNHSSPSAVASGGTIELLVGDYNGNLKHFACRKE
jgi:hypothetical protein